MSRSIFTGSLVLAAALFFGGSLAQAEGPQGHAPRPSPDDMQAAWNEQFDGPPCEHVKKHCVRRHSRCAPFGYTAEERRNFPDYYGGYRRYFGGFHANYYRDYATFQSGLNNDRYGYGLGWAW